VTLGSRRRGKGQGAVFPDDAEIEGGGRDRTKGSRLASQVRPGEGASCKSVKRYELVDGLFAPVLLDTARLGAWENAAKREGSTMEL